MLSKADYARHRGCDRSLITRWGKVGRLVMRDGLVDVDATDALLAKTADPRRVGELRSRVARGDGSRNGHDPLRAARIRAEEASAAERELDLAERRGELVRLDVVRRAAATAVGEITKAIGTLPARASAAIAAKLGVEARLVAALLDEESDALRQVAANALRRLIEQERAR